MKNLGIKSFSLLVAVLLAYFVHSERNEMGISVPVELRGLPVSKLVVLPSSRQVQVSLRGPSFLLAQIYSSLPSFHVRVPSDVGNRFIASLDKNDLALPPGVEVVSVDPTQIEFTLDNLIKKEVPVHVEQFGVPNDGVKISEISPKPNKIVVSGAEADLANLSALSTEPLDVRDITSDVEKELNLKINNKFNEISATQVKVKITVASLSIERVFSDTPVEVRSLSGEMAKVQPEKVHVKISGPKDRISALRNEEIVPYIRIHKETVDGNEFKVQIDLPKSVNLIAVDPSTVKVLRTSIAKKALKPETGKK